MTDPRILTDEDSYSARLARLPWMPQQPLAALQALAKDADAEVDALRARLSEVERRLPHCDACGATWYDDGLNPLACPYCRLSTVQALVATWRARSREYCYAYVRDGVDPQDNDLRPGYAVELVQCANELEAVLKPAPTSGDR